nr:immunoglobulin heavy chain junction region [Mus musculus]
CSKSVVTFLLVLRCLG